MLLILYIEDRINKIPNTTLFLIIQSFIKLILPSKTVNHTVCGRRLISNISSSREYKLGKNIKIILSARVATEDHRRICLTIVISIKTS